MGPTMSKMKSSLSAVAALLALGFAAVPASAANTRSFISANGLDTNACARTAPCRTLQTAHDNTNAGGEINMLDPAGYGPVTITKPISIVNDGVGSAGILVPSGGTGITINAGPTDTVNLRGLIVEGAGVGATGIRFNTGASLTIENCVVRGLTSNAIAYAPTISSTFSVSNTFVANSANGIVVLPIGSNIVAKAVISRVEAHNNGNSGIFVSGALNTGTGTVNATVTDSVASNNTFGMAIITDVNLASVGLLVVHSVAANNTVGLASQGSNAILRVAQSTVTGNTLGWETITSGVVQSYGDNYIDFNTSNEAAPPAVTPGKK